MSEKREGFIPPPKRALLVSISTLVGTLAIVSLVVACGPKRLSGGSGMSEWSSGTGSSALSRVLQTAKIDCASAEQCPPSVALVLSQQKTTENGSVVQCTGFLIAEDVLVTNSHCLDPSIRTTGASCKGMMAFLLPAGKDPAGTSFSAQTFHCSTVISATEIHNGEGDPRRDMLPDIAVLKLSEKTERPSFQINPVGLPNNLPIRVYAIDPDNRQLATAVLRVRTCSILQIPSVLAQFNSERAPIATGVDCNLVGGNSGSFALDNDGYVRAIAHGKYDDPKTLAFDQRAHQVTLFTNFYGFQLPHELPHEVLQTAPQTVLKAAGPEGSAMTPERYLRHDKQPL